MLEGIDVAQLEPESLKDTPSIAFGRCEHERRLRTVLIESVPSGNMSGGATSITLYRVPVESYFTNDQELEWPHDRVPRSVQDDIGNSSAKSCRITRWRF